MSLLQSFLAVSIAAMEGSNITRVLAALLVDYNK